MRSVYLVMGWLALGLAPVSVSAAGESASEIFARRILPLGRADKPSSCAECHAAGVDLSQYIKGDAAATFAALRTAGLVDRERPEKSKLLELIARTPEKGDPVIAKVRAEELAAFTTWIAAAAKESPASSSPHVAPNEATVGPTLPVEVIRHARQDRVLMSFVENIWIERERCAGCHSPDKNQRLIAKHGEHISWIKPNDPAGTLAKIIEHELIDLTDPDKSPILQKPLNEIDHGGHIKFNRGSRTDQQFRRFLHDYAATVKGKYQTAAELPRPSERVIVASAQHLRITDLPAELGGKLARVDLFRWEGNGWSSTPVAMMDGPTHPKNGQFQSVVFAIVPRSVDLAKVAETRQPLPGGRYLARLSVDRGGATTRDRDYQFGPQDVIGEIEFDGPWAPGYQPPKILKAPVSFGQDAVKTLTPAEAAKREGQEVQVELEVRSTGGGRNRYLNSEPDFSRAGNFTIFIPQLALPKFAAAQIEKPDEHYYGKVIQVTGTVAVNRNKPQITVQEPGQIKILDDKSRPPVFKKTHVYKQVEDLSIRADSYRFDEKPSRPVVVWIHGGGLINGHRESVPAWLTAACRANSCALVSLDYRLAPETQLPEIIADIEDAFRWIRESGPKLFGADPAKVAVVGGSAGGYLTLVAGYRANPRPVALVPLWGYGDIIGSWYSEPSSHARHQTSKLSREEAFQQVAGVPVSDSRERKGNGGAFYQFCRQQGLWPKAVSGWDPKAEADRFAPFMPVKNVTAAYPATLLIHGDQDTDVPYEQSVLMAAEFKKQGVPHELLTVAGAEHGLAGTAPETQQKAYRAAADFLRQRLGGP